jgi:hypothetical protein
MKRQFAFVATALLTLGTCLPTETRADTILINEGTAIVDDRYIAVVDIHGTQGFRAQLRLGVLFTSGPWQGSFAPTGTPISLDALFSSGDGAGTVELNGVAYPVPAEFESINIWTDGEGIPTPPLGTEPIRLSAPFTIGTTPSRSNFQVLLPSNEFVSYLLVGRGIVTLDLTPAPLDGGWRISRTQYEFQPIPEPGSLVLLGTGVAALAARQCRRTTRP